MTTIITKNYRTKNAQSFIDGVTRTLSPIPTYIFMGKSDPWSPIIEDTIDTPVGSLLDTESTLGDAYSNMMFMSKITTTDIAHVVPRNIWATGTIYTPYDDSDVNIFSKAFYVATGPIGAEDRVYKCVGINPVTNGPDPITGTPSPSTVEPIGTGASIIEGADGYRWKHMYTISSSDVLKFIDVTVPFIPTNGIVALVPEIITGQIHHMSIDAGGSGYVVGDTISTNGDGTGMTAVVHTVGTVLGDITSISITNTGSGYTRAENATITTTSGINAIIRPVISPLNGHGSDAIRELGSFYVCIAKLMVNDAAGQFVVGNDFRQIGIIQNLLNSAGTPAPFVIPNVQLLDEITIPNTSTPILPNDIILATSTGARAYVDEVIVGTTTTTIKYHQNIKTGYIPFVVADVLSVATPTIGGTTLVFSVLLDTSVTPVPITITNIIPAITKLSGEILTLENRIAISRSSTQTETVKIILEF